MKGYFNFRHVAHKVGVPSTNANNWAMGQMLAKLAIKEQVSVKRILVEKTDPDPTVDAPHCIAHYPMQMYDEACAQVAEVWKGREGQGTFDFTGGEIG